MSLTIIVAALALAFLLCQFDVEPKVRIADDPDAIRRDKPPQTPPEIRRKIATLKAEGKNLFAEYSKDGREVTDDEFAKLEDISHRQVQLERLLVHAERWHAVDSDLAEQRGRLGPSLELGPHDDPHNTRNGLHQYSLMKVMRHHLDPRRFPLDGLEAEVHDELVKQHRQSNLTIRGVLVPWNLPIDLAASLRMARRAGMSEAQLGGMLSTRQQLAALRAEERAAAGTLDTTAGAGSIPTILADTMIDLLRTRMVTFGLGARIMTGMQGKFAIPRQIQASTFYMVGEGGAISPSNQKIDQIAFSPHTGGVVTSYTRQFLEQTNQDAEAFVREDQAAVVARGVEYAGFNGQASSGFPMGILQNPQIDSYALGANGGAPTWAMLVALESHIAYFNADVGSLAYVTTALMRGTYKVTPKIGTTFPIYLWNNEGGDAPVNGYPCAISNILPQNITKGTAIAKLHPTVFGNWQDMIFAFWSGMDTIVDPYTQADSGGVRIVTLQDFDVNVRHFESFSMCLDQLVDAGIGVPIT